MNLSKEKTKNDCLSIDERLNSFNEVKKTYTKTQALEEASRCFNCKNPGCVPACPAHNNIPLFISYILKDDLEKAREVLTNTTIMPEICGRVCPFEMQCEKGCVRSKNGDSVSIGNLERYIADHTTLKSIINPTINKKVAIIGSGPASLACGYYLAINGVNVTFFEKENYLGGLLKDGIPPFVLPGDVSDKVINEILKLNVTVNYNFPLNNNIDYFVNNFDATFLGIGANVGKMTNINPNKLDNVVVANDFIKNVLINNTYPKDKKNIVIMGGGNVAIDAARIAKRIYDGKVTIVYRRAKEQMPARKDEIQLAEDESINFAFLTNPIMCHGNKEIESLECLKMELVKKENEDRLYPMEIENSNFKLDCDLFIMAISSTIDKNVLEGIDFTYNVDVNEHYQTNINSLFAGGDVINGPSTVVKAMKNGLDIAKEMLAYLNKNA